MVSGFLYCFSIILRALGRWDQRFGLDYETWCDAIILGVTLLYLTHRLFFYAFVTQRVAVVNATRFVHPIVVWILKGVVVFQGFFFAYAAFFVVGGVTIYEEDEAG